MSLQQQKSGNMTACSFIEALASDKPAADRADKMSLYGWLIGRWTMDATVHLDNGGTHRGSGEIYFDCCWKDAPFKMSGSCPVCFTALRCVSTTPTSMPGTFFGATRYGSSIRVRSAMHRAPTSCNSARMTPAKPCAG